MDNIDEKKTIVVIEDEKDLCDMIKFELEARGYKVITANNGVEAYRKIEGVNPDLIVLDLNMPQMGGLAFYEWVCDEKGEPRYPLFVLTARANAEELFENGKYKVAGFMEKPFETNKFLSEVKKIVK